MTTPIWHKSSYCGEGANCLNVAATPNDTLHLRESETPEVVLAATPAQLRALVRAAKAGRFDVPGGGRTDA
ncbi:DUF397 domain-containing protein [Streptomyces zagrosensis]|uniref:DUF397 domain-containing protein n=1 Tax=Streptomyces zagrosensis TaxID=1042984 RepID=A0A7W9QCX7_9ACTN|nr:DUF397 domain-containing protein [Streptomyces zagrosensis]MBB5937976.1 hypothetical protein [Streptomyces zagrosensis]